MRQGSGAAVVPHAAGDTWEAAIRLDFEARRGRTVLTRRTHRGPLVVQRPFYPEADVCHVYLLHPPGGIANGDRLTIEAAAHGGARALITTPAAGKFPRSGGALAAVCQRLEVRADAALEWLPQENIVFDGARAQIGTEVALTIGARFLGWDMTCLGRPAGGAPFAQGEWRQSLSLTLEGAPILRERLALDGRQRWEAFGRRDGHTLAAVYAWPAGDAALAAARARLAAGRSCVQAGATACDGALVCRVLADDAQAARETMRDLWSALRPIVIGTPACAPRIWAT